MIEGTEGRMGEQRKGGIGGYSKDVIRYEERGSRIVMGDRWVASSWLVMMSGYSKESGG